MSNNHAVWPDLVLASLLMIAGLLMLRYGVWHLVHHHEVVSPLLAGSGAVALGALSIRQALGSRFPRVRRYKRRPPSARTHWWFWAIVVSASANGFASAQVTGDRLDGVEAATASSLGSEPIVPIPTLPKKYDLNRVGNRGIGAGFNLHSMQKEEELGRRLSVRIDHRVRAFKEPVVTRYVDGLCEALSRQSDGTFPLTVKIIEGDEPNIFALPGGFLYVTTGLFAVVDNEAELAGLIAHEIAHIAARHATKQSARRSLWKVVSTPAMFVPFGSLAIQIGDVVVPMKISRDAELEADLLGLQYMYLAGYDAKEFLRFLDRAYLPEDRSPSRMAQMFSDYPSLRERLRRDQIVISTLPPRMEYVVDTSAFGEVQAKFRPPQPELRQRSKDSVGPHLRRRTQ